MFTRFACAIVVMMLSAAVHVAGQRSVDDFFKWFSDEWMRLNPNLATATRYFTGDEQNRLERQLTQLSSAARRQRLELQKRGLQELRRFDRTQMSEVERVSASVLKWQLETGIENARYEDYSFPLNQQNGANVTLVTALTVQHPLQTPNDARNYVARLRQVGTRMSEATQHARDVAARRLLPPRFILDVVVSQMRQFIQPAPAQNPFVSALAETLETIAGLSESEKASLTKEAEAVVAKDIYPQWSRAIAVVESFKPMAPESPALSRLPGGDDAYRFQLRRHTTTPLTADQIHEMGIREVARIERQMDEVLRRLGRTEGSVQQRIAQLRKDLSYSLDDVGRKQIMADIEATIADAERRSALQFDRRPQSRVVARRAPEFREATAAPNYTAPPLDGSRPGVFQMPLRPDMMSKFALKSIVYHEAIPGHHFQQALMREDRSLPRFRQVAAFGGIAATTEGWALYAERLAAESGWFNDDPEGLLGQLDEELFRARRLVVDTGLHAKGWSRQQALDYGIAEPSEVNRYVVNPGQACAYMIGQLKILELRDRAKQRLKDRFSERAFHNVVLGVGVVPLTILEQEVERYLTAARD